MTSSTPSDEVARARQAFLDADPLDVVAYDRAEHRLKEARAAQASSGGASQTISTPRIANAFQQIADWLEGWDTRDEECTVEGWWVNYFTGAQFYHVPETSSSGANKDAWLTDPNDRMSREHW